MRLDRYLAKSRILDIRCDNLRGALDALLQASVSRVPGMNREQLLKELMQRENTMTTYLGNGVAMPHIRVKMERPYIFAVGRCAQGLQGEELKEYQDVRLIFLLLAAEGEKNYLNVLASLARLFRERSTVQHIVEAPDLRGLQERVFMAFGGLLSKPGRKQNRLNRMLLREGEKIARAARCSSILLFSDTFAAEVDVTDSLPNFRNILVTRSATDRYPRSELIEEVIEARSYSNSRLAQLRSAVLIGLTRGIFNYTDRLCCIGGLPGSNQLDSIVVIDIEKEFQSVITREDLLPESVKIEVVERMLGIATELAVEGREGRPVGAMFVLGDTGRVNTMVKPLVLNPFYGYKEEDRNVLNPFMDETLKEFSVLDGCFIIRGDGVMESAGSLIHAASEYYQDMPGGFGARHSAAAAVTRAANCLAIVVSASTGQVTLFRRGVMMPLLDNPVGSSR